MTGWTLLLLALLAMATFGFLLQSVRLGHRSALAEALQAASAREAQRSLAAQTRTANALDGERRAATLLEHEGYAILGRQVQGTWTLRADGCPMTFGLRADYLVVRQGRHYIAEVKTGRIAPSLSHGPTRRQLLEYQAAFDVDGVVLVDAGVDTITHVEMDMVSSRRPQGEGASTFARVLFGLVVFVTGVALGAVGSQVRVFVGLLGP